MNCCGSRGTEVPTAASRAGRGVAGFFRWALPITALALVPKCPACVAAYVLLFTGIGLSVPAAAAVRLGLIVGCVGVLGFMVGRVVWCRMK